MWHRSTQAAKWDPAYIFRRILTASLFQNPLVIEITLFRGYEWRVNRMTQIKENKLFLLGALTKDIRKKDGPDKVGMEII